MTSRRFLSILTWAVFLNCLIGVALFDIAFGGDDSGKSGLDFNRGYDINTVTTVSGRVVSLLQGENFFIGIKSGNESINIYIGPGFFWEKKEVPLRLNDEITVKGSKAQGQDGKLYLLTQRLTNHTSGAQLELRNERGEAAWSRRDVDVMRQERPDGGQRHQGNMIMRGGGMMRR